MGKEHKKPRVLDKADYGKKSQEMTKSQERLDKKRLEIAEKERDMKIQEESIRKGQNKILKQMDREEESVKAMVALTPVGAEKIAKLEGELAQNRAHMYRIISDNDATFERNKKFLEKEWGRLNTHSQILESNQVVLNTAGRAINSRGVYNKTVGNAVLYTMVGIFALTMIGYVYNKLFCGDDNTGKHKSKAKKTVAEVKSNVQAPLNLQKSLEDTDLKDSLERLLVELNKFSNSPKNNTKNLLEEFKNTFGMEAKGKKVKVLNDKADPSREVVEGFLNKIKKWVGVQYPQHGKGGEKNRKNSEKVHSLVASIQEGFGINLETNKQR